MRINPRRKNKPGRKTSGPRNRDRNRKSLSFEQLEPRRLLAVLFADSFEQGEWNGQWVEDSQNDWFRSTHRANDGSYAAEVDGGATNSTLTMANPIDLTSNSSAELTFSWFIERNWDSGEYIALDMFDGNSWNEVTALNGNVDLENKWVQETITIDGDYLLADDFMIRFRANVSSNKEDGHVDNVLIEGTPGGPILPTISIDDVQAVEGDSGTSAFVFTVTRSGDTSGTSSVAFATADGTASAANDYVASSGTVQFLTGETSQTISFQVNGDPDVEADETFFVDLFNPTDATITDSQGQGTISNDDIPPPTISISDVTLDEAGTAEVFVPASSGGLEKPSGMTFGPDGNLYVSTRSSHDNVLRFDGATGVFLDEFITTGSGGLNDPKFITFGPDGNLYVTNHGENNVLRYDGSTGAFLDQFVASSSGGLVLPGGLVFGGNGDLYVTSQTDEVLRYDGFTGAFVEAFVPSGTGGLVEPSDLTFGSDGNLYVGSRGADDAVLRYDGISGAFIDHFISSGSGGLDNPTSVLFGSDGQVYVGSGWGDAILRYDSTTGGFIDELVSPGLSGLDNPKQTAFGPEGNFYFVSRLTDQILRYSEGHTVILSSPSSETVTVDYLTSNGSATAGADYNALSGTITFAPGETTKKLLLVATDDVVLESSENFVVDLSNPSVGVTITDSHGVATISDDDTFREFSIDDVTVTEGDAALEALFSVSISNPSSLPIAVDFTTTDGSATAVSDYISTSGTVMFEPGITTKTILIPTIDDAIEESTENFFVSLTNALGGVIVGGQGEATILDDDGVSTPPTLFQDSFENGQWNGLWVEDSQNDWFTSTQRSTDGSYSAEVDGNASDAALTIANPIDLSSYGSAELTFDWLIENGFDSGEYLALDFFNGSSWIEVLQLDGNVDAENTWHSETVTLDSQYLNNDFQFRYRADVNRSNEDANVDKVKLTGSNGGAFSAGATGSGSEIVGLDLGKAVSVVEWTSSQDLLSRPGMPFNGGLNQFQVEAEETKRRQLALPPIEQRFFQNESQDQIDREFAAVGRFYWTDIESEQPGRKGFESIDNLFGEFDQLIDEFEIELA